MRVVFFILLLSSIFVSCDQYKADGYSKTKSGLYYKVHYLGDGEIKAQNGDHVFAGISVFNDKDSLLFRNDQGRGKVFEFVLGSVKKGGLNEALSLMYAGDSVSFVMEGDKVDIKALSNGKLDAWSSDLKLNIKLNRLENSNTPSASFMATFDKNDMEMKEQEKLSKYLSSNEIGDNNLLDGIYFLPKKRGHGNNVQSGQAVWINYKGYFLDSTEFDNTYKYGQALDFQLGKPDQVIRGFEIALHQMKQGGKARLIIPSALAFGEEGSATGIVPPYTSVIYDLEVMLVN